MKRILFALALFALVSPALPRANGAEIGIDFFYDNLSGGSWLEVDDYGYCWQPDAAVNDPDWRPYSDGYWGYTDVGWTWVSYEDFGWATYHYGRWAKLAGYGWVWVPGEDLEWGPAWVSWRTGGDYIGWAPLPPRGPGIAYQDQAIDSQVDVEFDIGPEYYNFCDVRYMGEPVLRHRIIPIQQNITCIDRTVNVTRITVTNNVVYNYGPDINAINERSSRPIQRLHLQREQNVDFAAAAKSGGITKVQGDALVVAAPMRINRPVKMGPPPKVKTKVQQAKIEKGWGGIDPNQRAKIEEKIKTEDRTKVQAVNSGAGTGQQGVSISPTPNLTPAERGAGEPRGQGKRSEQGSQSIATPANSPSATSSPASTPQRGQHYIRRGEQNGGASPAATPPAQIEGTPIRNYPQKIERRNLSPVPSATAAEGSNEREGRHRRVEESPMQNGQGDKSKTENENRRIEQTPPPSPTGAGTPGDGTGSSVTSRGEKRNAGSNNSPIGTSSGERPHQQKPKGSPSPTPP